MFKFIFVILSYQLCWGTANFRSELYGSISDRQRNKSSQFNPGNAVLEVPSTALQLEWRPDFQYEFNSEHSVVIRTRHFLQGYEYHLESPDRTRSEVLSESDMSDLFASSQWTEGLQTTIGLQNYQWGPAEIFSPTNPFFHFLNDQRSFYFKEKGRVLFRLNWTLFPETARWSVIGIYEPINNRTQYWIADQSFKPKSLIKVDYQFENPVNQFAVVAGLGENQNEFIGEYLTWSPSEGHSIYADMKHQKGRTNYVPQLNNMGLYDLILSTENQKIFTTAVVGYRYEGRIDFRQEVVINEAGYNSNEWKNAKNSALTLSPQILTNSKRFAKPGLEFLTKAYSYTSIRLPDVGPRDQSSVSLRYLSSLQHNSAVLQFNIEHNWNDHIVVTAESLHYLGSPSQEFRLSDNQQTSLGFRYSF